MARLVINAGVPDGKKTFKNKEDLRTFIAEQRAFWQTFFSGSSHPISSVGQQLTNLLDQATNHINNMSEDETSIQNNLNAISNIFQGTPILSSESKSGRFVQSVAQKDPGFARYLVGYFTKQIYAFMNDPSSFRAIFEGMKFESGITSNIDAEREALGTLKTEWDENLRALEETFETTNSAINTKQEELDIYYTELQTQFDTFKSEKKEEFQAIIDTYDKKLALQAPVEYWKKRSLWSYGIAAVLAVVFIIAVWVIFAKFEPMAKDVAAGLKVKDYYPLIQFASITLIAIWLLRIIVKIFYSKLHLAEEAKEKEMFIKTYLSLLREGDGIKDDTDRHLILQTIFSSSQNGIIQDDGMPTSIIDALAKVKS
jgi:Family of unknown function (DUF6161)